MFQLNEHDRKFLQAMGRREDGNRLVAIFEKAKQHYSSIDSIDSKKGDADSQVEGRKIFCTFADVIINGIKTQRHRPVQIDQDDYT